MDFSSENPPPPDPPAAPVEEVKEGDPAIKEEAKVPPPVAPVAPVVPVKHEVRESKDMKIGRLLTFDYQAYEIARKQKELKDK